MIKRITNDPRFRIIVDLAEIISLIVLVIPGGISLLLVLKANPKLLILVGFIFLIATYFILSRTKDMWAELTDKIKEENIRQEIKSIRSPKNDKVEKFLPSDKQLKNWFTFFSKKARRWSEDAKFSVAHFSIYWAPSYRSLSGPSFTFYSDWKQEEISIYLGEEISETFREPRFRSRKESRPLKEVRFLKGFDKWRLAFMRSYKRLADKLGDSFTISVSLENKEIIFGYWYRLGKVEVSDLFSFDGVMMRYHRDDSNIQI